MTLGFIFWLLVLLWLLFGFYWNWPASNEGGPRAFGPIGGNVLLFILLLLLGIRVFGWPIQG